MEDAAEPTVLLVDDDPQVRSVYSAFLEDYYDVRIADSGESALEAMGDHIDIVLLDRRMVGLSGGDVLLRMREQGHDHPVVLVTAVDPDFDILEMGFDDYVVKPVGGEELRDVVETMLLRQEYDDVMREYFSLVSKVTALQLEKSPAELEAEDAFVRSQLRLEEIKEQAQTALEVAIEGGKFDELFHEFKVADGSSGATDRATEAEEFGPSR